MLNSLTGGILRGLAGIALTVLVPWSATGVDAQEIGAPIRAAHVDALRADVEALAPECSSVFRWTDDPIVPRVTQVKADHLVELRRAINDIAQGQCPTLQERVTFEAVRYMDLQGGLIRVEGFVLNSGSTAITDWMYVRVRFFDDNDIPLTEHTNYLRADGSNDARRFEAQTRRPFWLQVNDSEIQGWSYFQVVSFEVGDNSGRPAVLCSGCNDRYLRQHEEVTFEGVRFRDDDGRYQYVEGFVLNSGLTTIRGWMYVRIRFFGSDNSPLIEGTNYLRADNSNDARTFEVQTRRPFWLQWNDSEVPQDWSYFQVVSFEDEGRRVSCVGCGEYPRVSGSQ